MSIPLNYSSLQSGSWYAYIDGLENVIFKLRNYSIPSIELPSMKMGGTGNWDVKIPGTRLNYGDVQFEFSVDADFANYRRVYEWMRRSVINPEFKTVTIFILDGEKHIQNVTIEYYNTMPVRMTSILLDAQNTQMVAYCNMDIAYEYFDFVDLNSTPFLDSTTETVTMEANLSN